MNQRVAFLVVLVVVSGSSTDVLGLDQKTISVRTDHLRQMSEIERGRFHRNLQEFQKLSEVDKRKYRQLHEELVADGSRGGSLSKLLQTYAVWVQTLTPTQRDELAKENVPSQKLALIRRFKEEQDDPSESQDQQSAAELAADEVTSQGASPLNKREAFVQKDLRAVLAIVVNRLTEERMKPEFIEPRLADYVPIIHASVHSSGGNYQDWPGEKLLHDMIGCLSKESVQLVNRPDYKSRRDATIRLLLMGILKQARDAVRLPTESDKLHILQELTPKERDRIMNLPLDRMNGYLVRKSMEMKGGDALADFKKLPDYTRQIEELFQRLDVSPPPKFLQRVKKRDKAADRLVK